MNIRTLTIALLIIAAPMQSASATDLSTCMADALSGKERKELAKWIYFAMSSHPEIRPYSSVSAKTVDDSNRYVGKLITRLLVTDCPDEFVATHKASPLAVTKSFEFLGRVAMQELMADQSVVQAIADYVQYVDQDAIAQLTLEK